jgi:Holliday junction resolvasome RuvABC endonuclease subunit
MVHGAVRTVLLEAGVPYVLITPASVKKYATGRGNAGKPEMAVAAFKRAGIEFADDNECDAWWLRYTALHHYGHAPFEVPQNHRDAIEKIAWPTLEERR